MKECPSVSGLQLAPYSRSGARECSAMPTSRVACFHISRLAVVFQVSAEATARAACLAPRFRVLFGCARAGGGGGAKARRSMYYSSGHDPRRPRILLASRPTDVSNYMLS